MRKNCVILYNPPPEGSTRWDDLDTLYQLKEISEIYGQSGWNVSSVAFEGSLADIEQNLRSEDPDFVFNLVERVSGTDRLAYIAPAFLEYLGYPYTGCTASNLGLLATKTQQKIMLRQGGLPTADFIAPDGQNYFREDKNKNSKFIVKSDSEHASFFMTADNVVTGVQNARQKMAAMEHRHGGQWIAEEFIAGREIFVPMIEDQDGQCKVLMPAELRLLNKQPLGNEIYDFDKKWVEYEPGYDPKTAPMTHYFDFPERDQAMIENLRVISKTCWDFLGLKGYARLDFRLDDDGNPWILEINPNPWLAKCGVFVEAAALEGISCDELFMGLVPQTKMQKKAA